MVLPAQVTLAYTVDASPSVSVSAVATALAAVPLYTGASVDPVLSRFMALTVASDTTSSGGFGATRTIVLNMTPAAGAPFAPPFFKVHTPAHDSRAFLFSSADGDTGAGNGARTVTIAYHDAEGNAGTVTTTLQGKTPVAVTLAGGTNGIVTVNSFVVASVGPAGDSIGQITLAMSVADPRPAPGTNPAQIPGPAIAYLPNSYFALAGFEISAMKDLVRELFTRTLARALASNVTAADPVLS